MIKSVLMYKEAICVAFFFLFGLWMYYFMAIYEPWYSYQTFLSAIQGLRIFVIIVDSFVTIGLFVFMDWIEKGFYGGKSLSFSYFHVHEDDIHGINMEHALPKMAVVSKQVVGMPAQELRRSSV